MSRPLLFMWPMTGSMAFRRRGLVAGSPDFEAVEAMADISLVDVNPLDGAPGPGPGALDGTLQRVGP